MVASWANLHDPFVSYNSVLYRVGLDRAAQCIIDNCMFGLCHNLRGQVHEANMICRIRN